MDREFVNRTDGALAIALEASALFEQYEPLEAPASPRREDHSLRVVPPRAPQLKAPSEVASQPTCSSLEDYGPEYDNLYLTPL